MKTEGEDRRIGPDGGEGELQLLYSRMIAPFWDFQAGLRYEIRCEFAPYVGISWQRKLGDSADFTRDEGAQVDDLSVLAGLRLWF